MTEIPSKSWDSRFFSSVLRRVIQEELSPSPTEQARAATATTPVGRRQGEVDGRKAAEVRARSRARESERTFNALEVERDADTARAERGRVWLESQPDTVQAHLRGQAEQWAKGLGLPGRDPPKTLVDGYLHTLAADLVERQTNGDGLRDS
jgi:hypothetical protein